MIMTFDEYDEMINKFEEIDTHRFWVQVTLVEDMESNPDFWLPFLCYLLEKDDDTETSEEEYSKKTIKRFVNKHLVLVDSYDNGKEKEITEVV